ncbi:Serine/threonine-protein phosphatase 4 regulatory subunit 1 [Dissophora globulifera]|nr:Serine/threonine-protein phosphatase 4 regulatory subunit 1 [Dissophora globulifera]
MADLGLYFGEDDEDQLVPEDKALSYLVLGGEQDDSFDPVDTENLLAQMSTGSLLTHGVELDEDTDVVQLLAEPNLSMAEKAQLLSQSQYDFHRSFLAREMPTVLAQMRTSLAISQLIPIVRDFSLDPMDTVREALASQLDKIVLYFYRNSVIAYNTKGSALMEDYSEDFDEGDPSQDDQDLGPPPPLLHDAFTPVFMNLLLDQNAGIAHQTRIAIDAIAQNVTDEILESEILNGVITSLEKLYNSESQDDQENQDGMNDTDDLFSPNRDEQDGEAELGKMLVVVLLTALAPLLGAERCTSIIVPKLEKFTRNSQFYVRKEIVMALGALCKIVSQDVVVNRLLPLYDIFVQDDTWHIRRACCTILASFIGSLPSETKATKVEEVYDIFSVDVSRSVRNSIMEVLGEVIAGFEREKVPDSLLTHFLNMGQQPSNDHERAVMCAFSFPAVVLTAGPSKWELMKPVYMQLAACSLHEIARILGPELADRDLALAFADCLLAEDEVKEGVLGHAVEFISCLSPACRSSAMLDLCRAWVDLEQSSNWRLRDALAGQLPALCEIANSSDLVLVVLPMSVKACTDGVSTIRESGVLSFPALWAASRRVGQFPVPKSDVASAKDIKPRHMDNEDQETTLTLHEAHLMFEQSQVVQGLVEVEMEDMTMIDGSKEQQPVVEKPSQDDISDLETPTSAPEMMTVKEEIIRQTADFAINGGFRSRVVAVQIIQSLLDFGISVADFEQHFMPLLVDRLAKDSVVNIRIWVARVVTWIVDSGYYGDESVSPKLRELILTLQQDPDRDVRIYSGGPAELPKPPKTKKNDKKKSKKGGKKAKETRPGQETTAKLTFSVFHQNPRNGQVAVMEGDEDTEVHVMFDRVEHDDSDSDSNGDDDDEDDEDDDDDDDDEDDESDENDSNDDKAHQEIDVGHAVVLTNSTVVSEDVEIHTAADDHDTIGPLAVEHTPMMEEKLPIAIEEDVNEDSKEQEEDKAIVFLSEQPSGTATEGDCVADVTEHVEDEDDEEGEERVAVRIASCTAFNGIGVSPLDVEVEESFEEVSDTLMAEDPRDLQDPVSHPQPQGLQELHQLQESSLPQEMKDSQESQEFIAASKPELETEVETTSIAEPEIAGVAAPDAAGQPESEAPWTKAFPPLSLTTSQPACVPRPPLASLSYAALVKYGDDSKARAAVAAAAATAAACHSLD